MNRFLRTTLLSLLAVTPAYPDIAVTGDARTEMAVTVYQNCGYIRDTRKLTLPQGPIRIRFEGVAPGIIDRSVVAEWTPDNQVELLDQSYEYDLVSPQRLMEKFVGREVEVVVLSPGRQDSMVQRAELVSIRGSEPVFRIGTMITYGNIGRILFPYVPEDLYTKPTIMWRVQSAKRHDVALVAGYMVDGLSWTADYVFDIDPAGAGARFTARLNLVNNCGLDLDQALVTFSPGTIRRVGVVADSSPATVLSVGDHQIFPARKPITIRNGQTKQIAWIAPTKVKFKQRYQIDCPLSTPGPEIATRTFPAIFVAEIQNNEGGGLGIPLPEGVIRIFQKTPAGETRLLGEDQLPTTALKETIMVKSGPDPDVLLTRKTNIDRRKNDKGTEFNEELSVTNAKAGEVRVVVREKVAPTLRITRSSEPMAQIDSTTVQWEFMVKGRQTRAITLSFSGTEP